MTPSELKYQFEEHNPNDTYFCRREMRFFGDTMKNYGVRQTVITESLTENRIPVWELWRKRPVNGGLRSSSYFTKDTFKRVFEK